MAQREPKEEANWLDSDNTDAKFPAYTLEEAIEILAAAQKAAGTRQTTVYDLNKAAEKKRNG